MKSSTTLRVLCGVTMMAGISITLSGASGGSPGTDSLTGLPLYPGTHSQFDRGDPMQIPDTHVCRSTMKANFYSVYDSKVDATLAWYAAHLPGFKKTHGYAMQRSQDTFYKADGSVIVSVTGSQGSDGENTAAYSIVYGRFQPPLAEKTIVGMNEQKVVCQ